ncbi:MAG TPA: SDR family NAD(P)-dependent oxidoreductase [Pseudobdellovibrionaceae bacterium]|nr:SDR family NAD(P)-dependent oxidoreductase [Pseudobdellovibrionaceae bacterium]
MATAQRYLGKVVLITGAASGIGLATAKRIGSEGGSVVLVDISVDKLESAEKAVREAGAPDVLRCPCDVSRPDEVSAAAAKTVEHFRRWDLIVNNAGLMVFKKLEEHSPEDWNRVLAVDLLGTFFFTREAFLRMRPGGVVVNVSSVHAVETTPLVSSYAAAKAAVLSLTRSSSIEGKEKGIRVNAILPGAVETPMLRENPNIKSGLEVIHAADVGQPEDIAAAIAFLGSDDAKFIQGIGLRADGGRLVRL